MDIPDFFEGAIMGAAHEQGMEDGKKLADEEDSNQPDNLDEREIAEDILKRMEKEEKAPRKISLKARHRAKGSKLSPSVRWMYDVASGKKSIKDPVELTEEEQRAILKYEGEEGFDL